MGGAQSTGTKSFTRELPDTATASHGAVRVTDGERKYDPTMTLYTNLHARRSVDDGSRNIFGTRTVDAATGEAGAFEWVTFNEFLAHVEDVASGMRHVLRLARNDIVGVFSKNRYEWAVVEHSCNRMAYTLVPLYDTLGPDAVPYIVNHTAMKVVFCAKSQFATLLECAHACDSLETIVQFEPIDDAERALAKAMKLTLLTLADVRAAGQAHPVAADPPLPDDVCTICYTSGTTGTPKGAMLTHANLMFAVKMVGDFAPLFPDDVHLSYLPLAHIYERNVQTNVVASGGSVGFYQGDAAKLLDDLAALQPTVFPTVPRVLNRIYDKITQGVRAAGGVKQFLFEQALAAKKDGLENGGHLTHAFWDALVFNKLKVLMGGRVRLMMNGSAPLSYGVKEFIQIVFGCHILEGYGLTETAAGLTCSASFVPIGNHVGLPLPGLEVRLEDVPDMNYLSTDKPLPRGEILVRGGSVFKGYYKQPELTAQVLSDDGWFHTGDIGAWNENGTLQIIDRKKNIFKLSQGEYVVPEKVEDVYLKSPFVAQIYVHGDSLQNYVVGVVVPDRDVVAKWAVDSGVTVVASDGDNSDGNAAIEELLTSDALRAAIMADMESLAVAAKLFRFERVQKLHVSTDAFSIENDLLTPTFKLKRKQLGAHFAEDIQALYGSAPSY